MSKEYICPKCKKEYHDFHYYIDHLINKHKNMAVLEIWSEFVKGIHKGALK